MDNKFELKVYIFTQVAFVPLIIYTMIASLLVMLKYEYPIMIKLQWLGLPISLFIIVSTLIGTIQRYKQLK